MSSISGAEGNISARNNCRPKGTDMAVPYFLIERLDNMLLQASE